MPYAAGRKRTENAAPANPGKAAVQPAAAAHPLVGLQQTVGNQVVSRFPKKDGLASTRLKIPLLPALGSPTRIADLDPNTQVRVLRVIGANLAYEVVVVASGQTGFVPAYSIAELKEPAPAAEAPAAAQEPEADPWAEILARMPPMPDWPPSSGRTAPPKASDAEIAALLARQGISTEESYAKAHEVPVEQKIAAAKAAVRATGQDPAMADLHAREVRTLAELEGKAAQEEKARQAGLPAAIAAQPARDDVHSLLVKAGIPRSLLARHKGSTLDSASALELANYLLSSPPEFKQYGPRTVAMQLLLGAARSGQGLSFQTLKEVKDKHRGLVVYTPWGYLVDAATGESLSGSTMPPELKQGDGSFVEGPYKLGEFYSNQQNIIYRTDPETLAPKGGSIAEVTPKGIYTSFLDAAEEPLHQGAQGIRNFMAAPGEFTADKLKAIQALPSTIQQVLSNSPSHYVDMFLALPADRQHYVASQIVVAVGSMYLAGSAAASVAGGIGKGGSGLMLTLAGDGQLALRMVAAESGVAAGLGGALGAGGALILNTSGSGKKDAPAPAPAAAEKPVTAEQSIQSGLVKDKGLFADLLKGIQQEFRKSPSKNANAAYEIANRVTTRLSTTERPLRVGSLIRTDLKEGFELWKQNNGVETRFYFDGRIRVTDGKGNTVLYLVP